MDEMKVVYWDEFRRKGRCSTADRRYGYDIARIAERRGITITPEDVTRYFSRRAQLAILTALEEGEAISVVLATADWRGPARRIAFPALPPRICDCGKPTERQALMCPPCEAEFRERLAEIDRKIAIEPASRTGSDDPLGGDGYRSRD